MSLKLRLIVMNFLQFFVWGSWLTTVGTYCYVTQHWSSTEFGAIFATMGIASLFMPALMGIVADKWINAERLYGVLHLLGACMLFIVPTINSPQVLFWVMLVNMCFYMPTISLSIAVAYNALKSDGADIVTVYPPIRVWGTVGFIVAMWTISLRHLDTSPAQFHVAGIAAVVLGLYAFSLPRCLPAYTKHTSLVDALGLRAFALLKQYKMAVFFLFAMALGAALQLTNAYGNPYLSDFGNNPAYQHSFVVQYANIVLSLSQISETLFILAIPFFLHRFGIKRVMLISMVAWVLRFGLFAYGNPTDLLWMILLSNIVYGMAFDFFNISGSLFVESQADAQVRASAQGLFMLMTNGIGAILGSSLSGILIDAYFTAADGTKDWHGIWLSFAAYSLVVTVLFAILFRHKHEPQKKVGRIDAVDPVAVR
ncbi:MAG TPA: nucleoside permease [Rudaea sp.]|nr:nucleoside permease [Rudaea sp.]